MTQNISQKLDDGKTELVTQYKEIDKKYKKAKGILKQLKNTKKSLEKKLIAVFGHTKTRYNGDEINIKLISYDRLNRNAKDFIKKNAPNPDEFFSKVSYPKITIKKFEKEVKFIE
ncbi:MAG: hypothetical protein GF317_09840 [Candidatus Lokiarchaeota archaeon]|nr:hypothetical protein [Candidatus Lokiarchaeota archaeon]